MGIQAQFVVALTSQKIFKMAGPCCCSSNIQAAKVLGIIFVVLSLLSCVSGNGGWLQFIISGIIGALINALLVYGAHTRSSQAILVWIILAIIECIIIAVLAILAVVYVVAHGEIGVALIGVIIFAAMIIFTIWTIIVAKNARMEIEAENDTGA